MEYAYTVTWSPEDQEHVATCAEFPSLSWLNDDKIEALRGIRTLVTKTIEDMRANGEAVPEPLADRRDAAGIAELDRGESHDFGEVMAEAEAIIAQAEARRARKAV